MAVYNATKAYLDSLSFALADEMAGTGVTVTCLMPGPVDTPIFEKGDMADSAMAVGLRMHQSQLHLMSAALQPFHAASTANARRLARTPRRTRR